MDRKGRTIYITLLTSLALILLLRAPFGFNQADESFYAALAHRLWTGDKLITSEWHPCQFYSFILLPFYSLHRLIFPSGTGIILFFRVIYIIFSVFTSFVFFFFLEKDKKLPLFHAFTASAILMLFAKSGITGPSYNNLCVCFSLLAIILLQGQNRSDPGATEAGSKHHHVSKKAPYLRMFSSGICTAMAVLCIPYLAVPVIIYVILRLLRIKQDTKDTAAYITGILISAVIYVLCCFDLRSIPAIIRNMPYVFLDPEHKKGFLYFLHQTWWSFRSFFGEYALYGLLVFFIIFGILRHLRLKKEKDTSPLTGGELFLICVMSLCAAMLGVVKGFRNIGYPSIALTMLFIPVFVIAFMTPALSASLRIVRFLLICGLSLALAFAGGSDTRLNAVTVGFTLTAPAAVIALGLIKGEAAPASDKKLFYKGGHIFICTCLSAILLMMLVQRLFTVAKDSDTVNLRTPIERGPAAGLLTTDEHARQYYQVYDMLKSLDSEDGTIFFTRLLPWAYLTTNRRCAAPTSWRTGINDELLIEYYDIHPDRIPDTVVVFGEDIGAYDTCTFTRKKGSTSPNENSLEGPFWDRLNSGEYTITKTDTATIYNKR